MEATISIERALWGNVKVTVECNGRAIVNVWQVSEDAAMRDAEELIARLGWQVA